ncbi:MAG TPA: 3'-5' exonuclease, partial [Candidatus Binatus sp.]|nr:3'-5' exonuclease [Candidatus Binatus sp.]
MKGWLFDLYTQSPGRMIVWLKTFDKGTVKLVDRWKPSFYVAGKQGDLRLLSSRLRNENRFEEWYERVELSTTKKPVLRIFYDGKRDCENVKSLIIRLGGDDLRYRLYNLDIPPDQLYLYEKDLFPLAHVEAHESDLGVSWKLLDSSYAVDYHIPRFKTMQLEVFTKSNSSFSCAKFSDPLEKIVLQGEKDGFIIRSQSEEDKLLDLMDLVQKEDPDIIITKQGDSFQFPYLGWRAKTNNLTHRFFLGREQAQRVPEKHEGQSYVSYGHVFYRASPIRLMGRFHLDQENAFV